MVKSFLKTAAFVLVALSMAIPSVAPAGLAHLDVVSRGAIECLARGHADAVVLEAVWSAPNEPGSFPQEGSPRHLEPVLDGECDDLEPVDDPELTSGAPPVLVALDRWSVADPDQHGFAEGLFSARASRGPPQD